MNFIKLCLQTTLITKHDICLPAMCQTVDFHLTMMRASKLGIMVCVLDPVQMLANTFQPVIENFATLFFACSYLHP